MKKKGLEGVFPGASELASLMRGLDWAATGLGDPRNWPNPLKTAVGIMLTSRQPMFVWWSDRFVNLYNDAYRAILGGKHPACLGKPAPDVWREIWSDVGPRAKKAMSAGEGTYDESLLLIMERNGYPEETYYTFSYSPIAGDDGRLCGILCANTDDTRRIWGERQLSTLRALASEMAGSKTKGEVCAGAARALALNRKDIPFALIYLKKTGSDTHTLCATAGVEAGHAAAPLEAANESPWPLAEAASLMQPVAVGGLDRFDGLPKGDWATPPREALVLPISGGGSGAPAGALVAAISPHRLLDDDYRTFLSLAAGQIAAGVASAEAYEAERERAERLAEIDRAKTAFFSNVSHEFRTPLTLMMGPIEQALAKDDSEVSPGVRALLQTSHRNSLRLMRLVNALLDFSTIEAGRARASFEPTDLASFTADLASNFRSAAEQAGLELVIDCPPLPRPVGVDRDMWEKIVLNLVSNAFKFTLHGAIEISLRPSPDGAGATLKVRDTGTGIPADELKRVFERFHRVEGRRGRSFEGSGIGLALVRELVRLHGGTIEAQSELEKGSVFTVSVPYAHLAADPTAGATQPAEPAALRTQAFVEDVMSWLPARDAGDGAGRAPDRGRILLAEDNPDMRAYVGRILREQGYEVEAVADGELALEAALARPPALILSDVMMPRLDGAALARRLRAEPVLRDIPIMLLTARAGEEARTEGLSAGVDDYLTKPFTARELVARVGAALMLASQRRTSSETLRARTLELEAVLDTVPAAVWFARDAQATQITGNRYAATLLRLDHIEGGAMTAQDRTAPDFRIYRNGVEVADHALPMRRAARGEKVAEDEYQIRFANGDEITLLARAASLTLPSGEAGGAVVAALDITDRKAVETALKRQNRRLDIVSKSANDLIVADKPRDVIRAVFDAVAAEVGAEIYLLYMADDREPEALKLEASAGLSEAQETDLARKPFGGPVCGRVAQTRKPLLLDQPQAKDRETAAALKFMGGLTYMGFPIMAGQRLLGTIGFVSKSKPSFSAFDVALPMIVCDQIAAALDRDRLLRELKTTAARFETAEEASGGLVYECDLTRGAVWRSGGYQRLLGYGKDDTPPTMEGWLGLIHPDDADALRSKPLEASLDEDGRYSLEYRVRRKDGRYVWVWDRGRARRGEDGRIVRLSGTTVDLTERKEAETRRNLLNRELAHRVKNSLAVIQAMARHTLKHSEPHEFAAAFQARLHALAASHDLLTNANWTGADLETLARGQIVPYAGRHVHRLQLGGPPIELEPEVAMQVGLVLHELATNAAKYGSLSTEGGRVLAGWRVEQRGGERLLILTWQERGGPRIETPNRTGFGTRLIDRSAAASEWRFEPSGLTVKLTFALPKSKSDILSTAF